MKPLGQTTESSVQVLLEPRLVGDIAGDFFVPAYQRGYRWGPVEVTRLLDDIYNSDGKPYYLQPVVVKQHGDEWELVDGQQRLTTLLLVLRYMVRERLKRDGADYRIRYETRPDSATFLEDLDPHKSTQNIDFFHIYQAYQAIAAWFEGHEKRSQYAADRIYGALYDRVKVIWYQAPDDVDATTLFTRLNVGRIALTDAELVKASLLSVIERPEEVASQWDAIERDLRDPHVWAFITGRIEPEPTHIGVLLDTLAGGQQTHRPPYETFETLRSRIGEDPGLLWRDVLDLHSLVMGWFEDRDSFHKIGYLVARGVTLAELLDDAHGKTKSLFQSQLDERIRSHLALSREALRELTYDSRKTSDVLLLMNVETVRRRQRSSDRYSFAEHAAGGWTLEHIHAQNAQALNRAEQWREWLGSHMEALKALPNTHSLRSRIQLALDNPSLSQAQFRGLEQEVLARLSPSDAANDSINTISNLALLNGGQNSALSNSVFAVKRAAIISMDQSGAYIPVCTRNVFLKYYTADPDQQMHFWSEADRTAYLGFMEKVLGRYLIEGEDQA